MRGGSVPYYPEEGATIDALLRFQAGACGRLGSPLYESLLRRAAADFRQGGPTRAAFAGHQNDPGGSALVLRLMGAVHRLTLDGTLPELADCYRQLGADPERTWRAFRGALEEHGERLRALLLDPVQTNEVGRCAALLPGFLAVSAKTRLPLRLLEVGAAAGLNLRWDAYRYQAEGFGWGPADSAVRIDFEIGSGEPRGAGAVAVCERRGCDAAPIDPQSGAGRLTLLSYIWPDQTVRLERMVAAIELCSRSPVEVERALAPTWVAERLDETAPEQATVVYHSMVMQYLSREEREAFELAVREAGERAGARAPLAWLRMEPAGAQAAVRLTTWPAGEEHLLATAGYHGATLDLVSGAPQL